MSVQSVREAVSLAMVQRGHFLCHWQGDGYPTAPATLVWLVNNTFICWEDFWVMAKKAAGALPVAKSKDAEFKGFVNYVLSDADKTAFKDWDMDDHDLWQVLAACLQSGYKISATYNSQNDTYSATFMCRDVSLANAGLVLSSFAPDPYNAVKSLVFKHTVILDENWTDAAVKEQSNWG